MPKGSTVRLDDEQAEELEAIAEVDGVSVAEGIRQAIGDRIAERRNDAPSSSSACVRPIEDNQRIVERLTR